MTQSETRTEQQALVLLGSRRRLSFERIVPYLYLSPVIVLLGVFTYWALLFTAYLSLVRWNFVADTKTFVGLANYKGLTQSTQFNAAAYNTAIYVLASIPFKVLLPIPVAFFIWCMSPRFANIYKTLIFLPTLLSFVVISVAVAWLLNPYVGIVNELLIAVAGVSLPPLLHDSGTAIWTIIGLSAWKVMGLHVLLYLAGLVSINREYIEAMRVDGASDWRLCRHLIWPLLTPTTLFVLVITIIFSLHQVFTPIDILTQGGPSNSTTNLFYVVYQFAFLTFNVGLGSAGAVLLFVLLTVVTIVKLKVLERWVHYR